MTDACISPIVIATPHRRHATHRSEALRPATQRKELDYEFPN
jgi:hypothetical protein